MRVHVEMPCPENRRGYVSIGVYGSGFLARNPQTMCGMPSAATPDSSMLCENKFAITNSRPVRTRHAESLVPPDSIPQTMHRIPSAATPKPSMLRKDKFTATNSRPVRNRNAESLMPPDPIPQTMRRIPSTATSESLMPRENKFAATNSCPVRTINAESLMPPDPPFNPRPTRTNDTRRFDVPRLLSLNGYEAPPNIQSGMGFRLPYFGNYSGWLVRSRGQMWELWSPNSVQLPYYPGIPETNHCPKMAFLPQNRSCDGHLGRFNYTVSPQVGGMPWWPLIRRCLPDYATTNQFPEFNFVHMRWIDDPAPAVNLGQLEPSFIEDLI
jgi:hypothetical protein